VDKGWRQVIEFQPPGAVERLDAWKADNAEVLATVPEGALLYDVAPSSAGSYVRVRARDNLAADFREVDETEFSRPSPNLIVSAKGYSVEMVGRWQLCFREGGREMLVECETLAADYGIAIWARDIRAWQGDDESVSEADRVRILVDLERAFAWRGWPLQVTDRSGRLVQWD
jgi:hypothetical protein